MESANLHHQHQLQDQLVGSSSLANPSFYGVSTTHAWTPNATLNTGSFNPICNGVIINSGHKNDILVPSLNNLKAQDLGSHWTSNAGSFTSQSSHELHLGEIKEELSDSLPKFTEMLNGPSITEDSHLPSPSYLRNGQNDLNVLSEKLLLNTISSSFHETNVHQFSAGEFCSNAQNCSSFGSALPSRGNFSQIYPSINISNLNRSSAISSSSDMNLQAMDLMTTARFSGSFSQPSHDNLGIYKESLSFGLDDHIQQSSLRPSCSPSKMSLFTNEITESKRPGRSLMEPKATQAVPKKSRLDSRAACPPFKVPKEYQLNSVVRKEKLGDRIAALQQLVAPFGKTDTASVLMEAIGYIKFLQNQVETLSVPYMKSSRNRNSRTKQGGMRAEDGNEEPKRDLKSRGLCLVPLSCMSYVTSDGGGGGIWPPPNFGGGT